jgi:hypothetical protein
MGREIFGPEYLPYRQEKQMQFPSLHRELDTLASFF